MAKQARVLSFTPGSPKLRLVPQNSSVVHPPQFNMLAIDQSKFDVDQEERDNLVLTDIESRLSKDVREDAVAIWRLRFHGLTREDLMGRARKTITDLRQTNYCTALVREIRSRKKPPPTTKP